MKPGQVQCVCGEAHYPKLAWKHAGCVANKTITVANSVTPSVANKSLDGMRVELWREANRERYNKRQRELMRKRRAGFIGIAYG
jgi:hypothetical protein